MQTGTTRKQHRWPFNGRDNVYVTEMHWIAVPAAPSIFPGRPTAAP